MVKYAASGDRTSSMESNNATARTTLFAMPLKSLANFAAMPNELYQAALNGFRGALQQKMVHSDIL